MSTKDQGSENEKRLQRAVNWLARFVVNRKFYVLFCITVVTAFLLFYALKVQVRTFFPDLLPEHPYVELVKKYASFGGTNQVLVEIRVKSGSIFNRKTLGKIIKISEELTYITGVDRNKITSIGVKKIKNFKVSAWGIEFPSLMFPDVPKTEQEMEDLKRDIYSNTLYFGKLISQDSKAALITAGFFDEGVDYDTVYEKLEGIKKDYSDENDDVFIVGGPYLYGVISHFLGQTVMVFIMTGVVMFILALIYTSSLRLVLLPFLSAAICGIWGIGFIGLLGYNLDPLILVVPLLISARALSHSIQFNWRCNEEFAETGSIKTACENTIKGLFYPGLSGIITDGIGILLIVFVPIPIMEKLGLVCFLWAMSMVLVVLILNPIVYLYLPASKNIQKWREKKQGGLMESIMRSVALCSRGKPAILIVTATVITVVVTGWFALKIEVGDVYPGTSLLRPQSPYNEASSVIAQDFPGLMDPLLIIARADGDAGISRSDLMQKVSEFQFYLMESPAVKGTVSISDLVKNLMMKYQEDDPKQYMLPDTNAAVGAMLFLLMSGGAEPGDFDQYYTYDHSAASLIAYCKDHTRKTISHLVSYCNDFISNNENKDIHFDFAAGSVGVIAATNDAVARDQVFLSIAAFGVTFLFCTFFFQSFVAAGLLLVPLVVANLCVFGYMGFFGIGLNLQTLPVSTIAVGIGVDYGIYLLSRIKEESIRLQSFQEGLMEAIRTAGNAVTITAVLIIVGVIFWVISDIKFQSDMGILLAIVTFFHLLGTLFLLPYLVRVVKPKFILKEIGA